MKPSIPSLVKFLKKRLEIVDEEESKSTIKDIKRYVEQWTDELSHIKKYNSYDDNDVGANFLLGDFENFSNEFKNFSVMNSMRNIDPVCAIKRDEVNICEESKNASNNSTSKHSINLTHSVRRAQMMHQFGIGSMINFMMNESLMPQGLDTWDDLFLDDETTDRSEFVIHDERLAERLGVEGFLSPPIFRDDFDATSSIKKNQKLKLKGSVFPGWHVCSSCKALTNRSRVKDDLTQAMVCQSPLKLPYGNKPSCSALFKDNKMYMAGDLSPFRIIGACKAGHIQDLPLEKMILESPSFKKLVDKAGLTEKHEKLKTFLLRLITVDFCDYQFFPLRFLASTKSAGINNIFVQLDLTELNKNLNKEIQDTKNSEMRRVMETYATHLKKLEETNRTTTGDSKRRAVNGVSLSLEQIINYGKNFGDNHSIKCEGYKPWLVKKNEKGEFKYEQDQGCTETLTPIPRGSSAVYFPVSRSSIQIPQKSYLLYYKKMKTYPEWRKFREQALSKNGDQYLYNNEKQIDKFVEEFLINIRNFRDEGYDFSSKLMKYDRRDEKNRDDIDAFKKDLKRIHKNLKIEIIEEIKIAQHQRQDSKTYTEKAADSDDSDSESTSTSSSNVNVELVFRSVEYREFLSNKNTEGLKIKKIANDLLPEEFSEYGIESYSLISRLKETVAFCGFTRIDPPSRNTNITTLRKNLSINGDKTWLPAIENNGEGICIFFDKEKLAKWSQQEACIKRSNPLWDRVLSTNRDWPNLLEHSSVYLFLHTFAHLLINEFSFTCGYSSASLKERIYCNMDSTQTEKMAAILIYTSASDSEGSLGGLVRLGSDSNQFYNLIYKSIEKARWCSNDPVCIQTKVTKIVEIISACHNCCYIPETACENFNAFLDRAMVVGTLDNPSIGFINWLKSQNTD